MVSVVRPNAPRGSAVAHSLLFRACSSRSQQHRTALHVTVHVAVRRYAFDRVDSIRAALVLAIAKLTRKFFQPGDVSTPQHCIRARAYTNRSSTPFCRRVAPASLQGQHPSLDRAAHGGAKKSRRSAAPAGTSLRGVTYLAIQDQDDPFSRGGARHPAPGHRAGRRALLDVRTDCSTAAATAAIYCASWPPPVRRSRNWSPAGRGSSQRASFLSAVL
jgi:hypothetical protein